MWAILKFLKIVPHFNKVIKKQVKHSTFENYGSSQQRVFKRN